RGALARGAALVAIFARSPPARAGTGREVPLSTRRVGPRHPDRATLARLVMRSTSRPVPARPSVASIRSLSVMRSGLRVRFCFGRSRRVVGLAMRRLVLRRRSFGLGFFVLVRGWGADFVGEPEDRVDVGVGVVVAPDDAAAVGAREIVLPAVALEIL